MQDGFILFTKTIAFFILMCCCIYSCAYGTDKAAAASIGCTPDLPGYNKPWIEDGLTPCDWAGYECSSFDDCLKCNVAVANCEI